MQNGPHFDTLTPDGVLDAVESVLDARCSSVCRPLNSYINRVYDVALEDGGAVIAKFYRPGRWSDAALQDEHDFVLELEAAEIPVVAPLRSASGGTLHRLNEMRFAVFPRIGGRVCDEPTEGQWRQLGRLLARMHAVGSVRQPRDRIVLTPSGSSRDQVRYILESGCVPAAGRDAYAAATGEVLDLIEPLFADAERIRLHGDLHYQNIIHRPGEAFRLIDFDDMAVGAAVQDLWMLLPGRVQDSRRELDVLLDGYETFRAFDESMLRLVEPQRAMRYIHYAAWCVRQAADGGFARLAPDWGTEAYWTKEVHELQKQRREIEDALAGYPC